MLQFLNQPNNFKIAYPYEYKITFISKVLKLKL